MKKKVIKIIITFSIAILFIELFGGKLMIYFSDSFQHQICMQDICINKPTGWLPAIVKKNNVSKIFNIINEKFLFTNGSNYYFKDKVNGVLLVKESKKIIILELKNIDAKRDYMIEKNYYNQKHLVFDMSKHSIVVYPKGKIFIKMDEYDEHVIHEIIGK